VKVIIDLEDLKEFVNLLPKHKDEWYAPVNYMTGDTICGFLEWNGKNNIAKEFRFFLEKELETK
jgi:hypothetical protein